jgi:hypothetical protein
MRWRLQLYRAARSRNASWWMDAAKMQLLWYDSRCGNITATMSNPNADRRRVCYLGMRRTGVSRAVVYSCGAENKPRCRQESGYVSKVIYQKCYLMRLFYVSDR